MFPLASQDFPTSADELAAAIEATLADVFSLPGGKGGVSIAGGEFPALRAVTIRLDGATVSAARPPPAARPATGRREGTVTVETLDVSARPVHYQRAKLDLTVSGTGLTFEFARDAQRHPMLVLSDADDGKVEARIALPDLQALLLAGATAAAAEQKVAIQDLHVELTSDGPRSVAATVRVKARKMMMTGVIVITGRVDVDEAFTATVSGLACKGEGIVGAAAAAVLQRQLHPFDGTRVPLVAFSLGEVKLRDLRVVIADAVEVSAAFGNGG